MKARQLIEGAAAYDPSQMQMIIEAFEQVWSRIEPTISRAEPIEDARVKLARTVLKIAANGVSNPDHLREEVLRLIFTDTADL